jgi:hypothetical protein
MCLSKLPVTDPIARRSVVGVAKGQDHSSSSDFFYQVQPGLALSGLPSQLTSSSSSLSLPSQTFESGTRTSEVGIKVDPFVVMGIETSCDDIGVGIVTSDGQILANVIISQVGLGECVYV